MSLPVHIRQETKDDYRWVVELTERAFKAMPFSDGDEGELVENLHKSTSFIPELSLVAEMQGRVVGHILFSPVMITNQEDEVRSLTMAPVSVLPEFQNQGIGSQLIRAGHQKARELGFSSIIVFGHAGYYPRFGYQPCSKWGIKAPFPIPHDNVFMALELTEDALEGVSGMVVHPPEFKV